MSSTLNSGPEDFLAALDISVTELAALRGVSRQYATRDLNKFLNNVDGLNSLCRTLLVIDTDSSRVMAERLRKFAAEKLNIQISVGSSVSTSKTYTQLFSENKELWIFSSSPLDIERSEYWEKLCSNFLDHKDRLLVYFVPSLEIADRLASRFEIELLGRQYDSEGNLLSEAEAFGATIFVIVTNLAASIPYLIVSNPGSANLAIDGMPPSAWVIGKDAQDLFEIPAQFADQMIQNVRTVGLGVARSAENFFPLGQQLRDSGIPFRNYPNIDLLIGVRMEHSIGMFEGEPIKKTDPNSGEKPSDRDGDYNSHPLKFYPAFIRAYRKKAGEKAKKKSISGEKKFFNF